MHTRDLTAITRHAADLAQAFDELNQQVQVLWLAAHGAASMVPDDADSLVDILRSIHGDYGRKWERTWNIQAQLDSLLKDAKRT
ncbi:hypothetical protein [Geminicoccus flavidas]|uniref:hypothetical protein n=1 Tax=Geminicoccus flavidas TaxID=2506407 RepID=UPI00135BDF02|nr:hypothetical protein [Geminicoccus flavidas]